MPEVQGCETRPLQAHLFAVFISLPETADLKDGQHDSSEPVETNKSQNYPPDLLHPFMIEVYLCLRPCTE